MHRVEDTPRVLTVFGLVVEALVMMTFTVIGALLLEVDMTWLALIFLGLGMLAITMLMINMVIFTKLLKGQYDEPKAALIYRYQAIMGGLMFVYNPVSGALYLFSALLSGGRKYHLGD